MRNTKMTRTILRALAVCAIFTAVRAYPAESADSAPKPTASANSNIVFKDGQTVAFVGDSITRDGLATYGGYGFLLVRALKANQINIKPIKAGNGGECSVHMLGRIDGIIKQKPDWITLSCGVNDVGFSPTKSNVSLEDFKKATTELVDRIQAAGIPLVLLTPTMIGEDQNNPQNQRLIPYVAHLVALAKEKGVRVANLNAAMQQAVKEAGKERTSRLPSEPGLYLRDGVHMNQWGDLLMARGIMPVIGMNSEQIEKAEQVIFSPTEPASCEVSIPRKLTVYQYKLLDEAAKKENLNIQAFLNKKTAEYLDPIINPKQ